MIKVPRGRKWTGFSKRSTRPLTLYEEYTREEIHDIFDPGSAFKPRCGTWGLLGLVRVPVRPRDFVFMVTVGQEQAGHRFREGITRSGLFIWQSQPHQGLDDKTIIELINHDHSKDSIHLFLRTRKTFEGRPAHYTYLGRLAYVSHDPATERPVWFKWQILDWALPEETRLRMGLEYLEEPEEAESSQPWNAAFVTRPTRRDIALRHEEKTALEVDVERPGEDLTRVVSGGGMELDVSSGGRRNYPLLEGISSALSDILARLSHLERELKSKSAPSGLRNKQLVDGVSSFRSRVHALHNEWQQQLVIALQSLDSLSDLAAVENGEQIPVLDVIFSALSAHGSPSGSQIRVGRGPTHDATFSPVNATAGLEKDDLVMPILESLVELGGKAPVARILDQVEDKIAVGLSEYDKETPRNQKEARWRLRIRGMRRKLETAGLLDRYAPWGVWAITEKGRAIEKQHRSRQDHCG